MEPYHWVAPRGPDGLRALAAAPGTPLWVPTPMPPGWALAELSWAGDARAPRRASGTGWTGPGPLGGWADLAIVTEEPGVGLGARLAGRSVAGPDVLPEGLPHAVLDVDGHRTPLWVAPSPADRAVFVGEARGGWLYILVWPAEEGALILDLDRLVDAREVAEDPVVVAPSFRRLHLVGIPPPAP